LIRGIAAGHRLHQARTYVPVPTPSLLQPDQVFQQIEQGLELFTAIALFQGAVDRAALGRQFADHCGPCGRNGEQHPASIVVEFATREKPALFQRLDDPCEAGCQDDLNRLTLSCFPRASTVRNTLSICGADTPCVGK
jgi:hypothetical protein